MTNDTRIAKKMNEMSTRLSFVPDDEVKQWEVERKMITEGVGQARKNVSKSLRPEQRMFTFMPRDMTRASPFFPMSSKDLSKDRKVDTLTFKNNWGTVTIDGEKLSIFDETVLLVLLSIAVAEKSNAITTTIYKLCQLAGVKPAGNTYKAIDKTISRLIRTTIKIETKRSKKSTEKLEGNILTFRRANSEGKQEILFNSYFLKMFGTNFTQIDFDLRASLKGDIAKALYRFLESHDGSEFGFPLFVLCRAININMDLPIVKMRSRIRTALRELEKKRFLAIWDLDKNDYISGVKIEKSTDVQ